MFVPGESFFPRVQIHNVKQPALPIVTQLNFPLAGCKEFQRKYVLYFH